MAKKLTADAIGLITQPVFLVTVADKNGTPDVFTASWVSVICFDPLYLAVSIEAASYAHELIESNLEFVVNLVNEDIVHEADLLGKTTGREGDKFEKARITAQPAKEVKAPLVLESPMSVECKVQEVIRLGTHDLYIGRVVATHVEESVLEDGGKIDIDKLRPIAYAAEAYWSLGQKLGDVKRMAA